MGFLCNYFKILREADAEACGTYHRVVVVGRDLI